MMRWWGSKTRNLFIFYTQCCTTVRQSVNRVCVHSSTRNLTITRSCPVLLLLLYYCCTTTTVYNTYTKQAWVQLVNTEDKVWRDDHPSGLGRHESSKKLREKDVHKHFSIHPDSPPRLLSWLSSRFHVLYYDTTWLAYILLWSDQLYDM